MPPAARRLEHHGDGDGCCRRIDRMVLIIGHGAHRLMRLGDTPTHGVFGRHAAGEGGLDRLTRRSNPNRGRDIRRLRIADAVAHHDDRSHAAGLRPGNGEGVVIMLMDDADIRDGGDARPDHEFARQRRTRPAAAGADPIRPEPRRAAAALLREHDRRLGQVGTAILTESIPRFAYTPAFRAIRHIWHFHTRV
jgi:hypothetical protein